MEILVVILAISFLSFGVYCALNSNNGYLGISEGEMAEEKTYTEEEVKKIESKIKHNMNRDFVEIIKEIEINMEDKIDDYYHYKKDGFDITVKLSLVEFFNNYIQGYRWRFDPHTHYKGNNNTRPCVSISKDGHTIIEKRVKNKEEINKLVDNVIDKFTQYNKSIHLVSLKINGRSKSYYMWLDDYIKLLEHWREQESDYLNVKPILEDEFTIPKGNDKIEIKEEYRMEWI